MPKSVFCVKLCDVNISYLYFYIYIHIKKKKRLLRNSIKELLCEIVYHRVILLCRCLWCLVTKSKSSTLLKIKVPYWNEEP